MNTTPICGLETHTHLYKGSKGILTMDADDLLKILHEGRSPIPLNANVAAAPNSMESGFPPSCRIFNRPSAIIVRFTLLPLCRCVWVPNPHIGVVFIVGVPYSLLNKNPPFLDCSCWRSLNEISYQLKPPPSRHRERERALQQVWWCLWTKAEKVVALHFQATMWYTYWIQWNP